MQIVIDIPDNEYYDTLQCVEWSANTDFENLMIRALKEGTVIPKGHGRIIDEDQIPGDGGWDFSDRLMSTPTIIEADKEMEE